MPDAFSIWNRSSPASARAVLLSFCGSDAWARTLSAQRPYSALAVFVAEAERLWFALPEAQWLLAFACHPRIGEQHSAASSSVAFALASTAEQAAAQASLSPVADALAAGNRLYEERFGFLYLVFANGRTAPELLDILRQRLGHDRASELAEAARQQWLITHLRIKRYFEA